MINYTIPVETAAIASPREEQTSTQNDGEAIWEGVEKDLSPLPSD